MNEKQVHNIAASIRQRLLNLARERHEDFGLLLTTFAIQRFLYRLGSSAYAGQFILKGAQLFPLWMDIPHRATRDLDLLHQGYGDLHQIEVLFREICLLTTDPPDGITYVPESVHGNIIREDAIYEGIRLHIEYHLQSAKDRMQIDIGIGDAVVPSPIIAELPSLLDFPRPQLKAYPRESVIAEKVEAMVSLGMVNSRMKDFFDLWMLAQRLPFNGDLLCQAFRATFTRRQTQIPSAVPTALQDTFASDVLKTNQWSAFLRRNSLDAALRLIDVVADLRLFLLPPLHASAKEQSFTCIWTYPSGWSTHS